MPFNYMHGIKIDHSTPNKEMKTEIRFRGCWTQRQSGIAGIECHVDHYARWSGRKRGRTQLIFPVLTIEQARQLRDNIDKALSEAETLQNGVNYEQV